MRAGQVYSDDRLTKRPMTILFIRGINDNNKVTPHVTPAGQVAFEFDGSCSVYRFMDFDAATASTLILFPPGAQAPAPRLKFKPSLIFNEISDPDSHRGTLNACAELCEQYGVPVINDPGKVLQTTRDGVASLLGGISGVRMPATERIIARSPGDVFEAIERTGLRFPVIVRMAGVHGGKSNVLIAGKDDLAKLHIYPFDGSSFYLTQFVDYHGPDDFYRKLRLVYVDGDIFLRHLLVDPDWMIHASSQEFMHRNPLFWDEDRALYAQFDSGLKPTIEPVVREIARRLGLEYFGIDCSIDEAGGLLIFEANANMNVLVNRNPLYDERVERIKQRIKAMIHARNLRDEG